ncbi:hypothetical protein [Nitrosomonas sp.]|uniref:hypothetical protein n=1 Tax=Nitrosomonas sp. TaxID=42353 RepID=UPI0025CC3300|nr:hypothetical protein [Nitrosomonas sp.]MBV6448527.1 hypothetical protein [Nitrosomonas sp.]
MARRWVSDPAVAFEGVETSDGRTFDENAFVWRDLPLSLLAQFETQAGHDGAVIVGVVDDVRRDGDRIVAAGSFDDSPEADRAVSALASGSLRRVSVDYATITADIDIEEDDEGWIVAVREQIHEAEIGAVTLVSFSTFADAAIRLDDTDNTDDDTDGMAASGSLTGTDLAAVGPPTEWFTDPAFDRLHPLSLDDDGRLAGHIARWGQCHISHPDTCVTAPRSASGYAHFRTGHVICANGARVPTGVISLGAGHAAEHLPAAAAVAHYDNACTAVADVTVGEDDHGIWVSGRARPGVDADTVAALLASSTSGDWRLIGGNLELVAVLAVNVPGFPVAHPKARVASAECVALVAAGHITPARAVIDRELLEGRLTRLGYPKALHET